MIRELRLHVGVFTLLLGSTFFAVRFDWVGTGAFAAVAPLYVIYLGVYWIWTSLRSRREADTHKENSQ